jgi:A/G-specific adenine glycosylase
VASRRRPAPVTKANSFEKTASPTAAELRPRVTRKLLSWFDKHQRELPWRQDRDPYRIWVSEIMLQQTQVATVIPYFERFLAAFPTLAALAAADEQSVLQLWQGLGYYRRARDLLRAARLLVANHGGAIPNDPTMAATLPGFGRYTCNAVLSQAFDRRLPILEANSQRVLSRLFGRTADPRGGEARRWLWQAAEELLPTKRVGEFNQGLMELGALVCTPAAPRCADCPLAADCVARKLGLQESIPARSTAPAITAVRESAIVIWRGQQVLLAQRPADASRWASMWEFPRCPLEDDETHEMAAARLAADLLGLRVRLGAEMDTIRHGITRYQITVVCFEAVYESGEFASNLYKRALWLDPRDLATYPASTPQRRLAKTLTTSGRQKNLF